MEKNNDKFVSALGNFTEILKDLVDALNEDRSNDTTKLNSALSIIEEQLLITKDIVKGINAVREDSKDIKSKNNEILEIVRDIKNERENGIFSRISSPDNKRGLLDGTKSIILMAGAILAIGKAFDIIDDVNFESVAALSLAIPVLTYVFSNLVKEQISPINALKAGFVMVTMAASIALSGAILNEMPRLGIGQAFSALLVAGAIGASFYLLSKALAGINTDNKTMLKILAVSTVMPLMAAGILGSAHILTEMPTIGFMQGVSAVLVATAMSGTFIALAIGSKFMNNSDLGKMMLLPAIMPIIAAGVVGSAFILNEMPIFENGLGIIGTTLAASTAVLAGGLTLKAISLLGLGPKEVVVGGLLMNGIALAIVGVSHILSLGNYEDGPTLEWATAMGLSMLAAVPTILIMGAIAASGAGALVLGAGALALLGVAGTIVGVSHILNKGSYKDGPTPEWAEGTGKALVYFTSAMAMASPGVIDFMTKNSLKKKIAGMKDVVHAMIEVAKELNTHSGQFKNGPPASWAEGTGKAIAYFVSAMNEVGDGVLDKISQYFGGDTRDEKLAALKSVVSTMIEVGNMFSTGKGSFTNAPSVEWAKAVGWSLKYFIEAMILIDDELSVDDANVYAKSLFSISMWMRKIGNELSGGVYDKYPDEKFFDAFNNMLEFYEDSEDFDIEDGTKRLDMILKDLPKISSVMSKFNSAIGGGVSVNQASSDIEKLARSYNTLADSMYAFANALKSMDVKSLPAANIISSNLIALSLIKSDELDKTLKVLDGNASSVEKLYATITKSFSESVSPNLGKIANNISGKGVSSSGPVDNTESSQPGMIQKNYGTSNKGSETDNIAQMVGYLAIIADGIEELVDLNNGNNKNPLGI